jgi:hypothetical protein
MGPWKTGSLHVANL